LNNTTQGSTTRLDTILSWITTTSAKSQSRQLMILQLILAWAMVIAIGYAIAYQVLYQEAPIAPMWRLVLFIVFYAISRTRYYIVSIVGVIVWVILQPYTSFIILETQREQMMMVVVSIAAIPIAGLFLSKRLLYLITALVIVNLLILWFVVPNIDPLLVLILIVISATLLIWFLIFNEMSQSNTSLNNFHQQLLTMSPDITAMVVKNHFTYINPAGLRILGATEETLIGKPLNTVIPLLNTDTPNSNKYLIGTNHLGDMVIQSIETIQPLNRDSYRALVTFTPFEYDGEMATLLTAKSLPSSISQSEQILESTAAVSTVHQNNKIMYISSQFERLTGYSREKIYSADYAKLSLTHEDDKDKAKQWIAEMIDGTSQSDFLEYRMIHKDGSIIWVRSTGTIIRYAGKPALLTTTIDITSYHTDSSSKLIQDELPFPWLLVKNQDDTMIIVDFHTANVAWFEDDPSLIGKPISKLSVDLSQSLSLILHRPSSSNQLSTQRNILKTGNDEIPIEWTATQLENYKGADYLITLRPINYETELENDVLRYRTMFDMMNDYAFLTKVLPDGSFDNVWVSNSFEKITGYDPHIVSAVDLTETTTYDLDRPIRKQYIDQLMRGEMSIVEHRIITKSGQVRWLRKYAYPEVENGRTTLIYGSVSDITERVLAEEAVKNSALQQSVIAEIGLVAVRDDLEIEDFAQQALSLVTQLMMVTWCVMIEYHITEQTFTVHSIVGDYAVSNKIDSSPTDENSYLGYVLRQNDPILVTDWTKETRFRLPQTVVDTGIQTSLSVVIPMQDQPFGILSVHDINQRQFTGAQINLLQTVANIIGTYIQQRQTQSAERKQRIMAEALIDIAAVLNSQTELEDILRLILDIVAQLVSVVDSSNIMLIDRETGTATITIRHNTNPDLPHDRVGIELPLAELPIVSKVIKTGKPTFLNDVSVVAEWYVIPETNWIKSYLCTPIFAGSECIGVINLDSAKLNAFTSQHVKQIQAFLDQASIAIQNARHAEDLVNEVEKRTQQLQEERAQFQAILNSTGEGIFYLKDFKMLFTNEKLAEMMGYTEEEMLGQSSYIFRPDDLTEPELQLRQNIQSDLDTFGLSRAELRFRRKDGTIFMGGVTASVVAVENGIRESVTVVRDISKEKEIEAQKETFISNAAHELRNPITTLNTRMYIIKNKKLVTKEDVEKLDVVVQKMNALVSGLLDLSRFESGRIKLNLQSIILQDILDDVMSYQLPEAEKKQMTLTYTAPDEPITMIADSLRFNQVLTNFVSNSINYTPEGGTIQIVVNYVDNLQDKVMIEVIDNGIGIDKDSLKSIFQPFSQAHNNTSNSGTGLGLSISKQIVEAHGGHIQVESIENQGSRFILYMPTTAISQDEMEKTPFKS